MSYFQASFRSCFISARYSNVVFIIDHLHALFLLAPLIAVPPAPIHQAPPPPPLVHHVVQPVSAFPYLRRFYVLFNLQRPAEMLKHGVRDFIVKQMAGRPIGGMIYRSLLPDYGQCIIIRASGTPDALNLFENSVLRLKDTESRIYWEYSKFYKQDEPLEDLINYDFTIAQSTRGAVRGPKSDQKYDNKSERQSSQKSGSEK